MSDLTPADHVALELCPQHVACAGCQHRADVTSRLIDERLAAAYAPVHALMRTWALEAGTPFNATTRRATYRDVLDDLRKVVGKENPA